jgi:hypothetical protein
MYGGSDIRYILHANPRHAGFHIQKPDSGRKKRSEGNQTRCENNGNKISYTYKLAMAKNLMDEFVALFEDGADIRLCE